MAKNTTAYCPAAVPCAIMLRVLCPAIALLTLQHQVAGRRVLVSVSQPSNCDEAVRLSELKLANQLMHSL